MSEAPTIAMVPIEDIRRHPNARALNDDALAALADSIGEVGLINPIRIRRVTDANGHIDWEGGYEVTAGAHRFAACDALGWREIACILVPDDDLCAELAMIDENLCRAELSPVDRAQQTARRKAIYLELHPETALHIAGAHASNAAQGNATDNLSIASFASSTAAATGKDERSVRRDAERGEKVCEAALEMVRGTALDTGTYLDKIKRIEPDQQVATVRRDLDMEREKQLRPKAVAVRAAPAEPSNPPVTFADLRGAIEFLGSLTSDDFRRLCPPNKRAAMCQRLSALIDTFEQVKEAVAA